MNAERNSIDTPDRGSDGAAQLRRTLRSYTTSHATEPVTVTRYSDATLHDRMHQRGQLSDRQHDAACQVERMWHEAGLDPQVTADYRYVSDYVDSDRPGGMADFDAPDDAEEMPIDRYRNVMRSVSRGHSERIEAMLGGVHPGVAHLATLQAALDAMGDVMGLEWVGVGRW